MNEETREKVSRTYSVDEDTNVVVCGHVVTHKNEETGEKKVYAVTSTHDFSNLAHRALLKLASMQAKIKRKNEMGIACHANGTTEFVYAWTDEDVDGKGRAEADPVKAALKQTAKMTPEQLAAFIRDIENQG